MGVAAGSMAGFSERVEYVSCHREICRYYEASLLTIVESLSSLGDDIPLVARLIALADAFDAMSSTRTYRPTLSRDEVVQEILDCAGTQFDPELAPVFVKLDFAEYDRLFAEHQAREKKGRDKDRAA